MIAAVVLAELLSRAANAPVELRWTAPPQCPTQSTVAAKIDALLEEPPSGDTPRLRASGQVTDADPGWVLSVGIESAAGRSERRLTARSCETLADAFAVEVAIAVASSTAEIGSVAPARVATGTPRCPDPPTAVATTPRVCPTPAAPALRPVAVAPTRAGLVLAARVGVGAAFGPLPRIGSEVSASIALQSRGWRAEIAGAYQVRQRWSAPSTAGGARFEMGSVTPRGCLVARVRKLELPQCLGVTVGIIHAAGVGVLRPRALRRPWVAAALTSALAWPVTRRFAVVTGADLLVSVVQPGFAITGLGSIHRAPAVAARVWAGIELRPAVGAEDRARRPARRRSRAPRAPAAAGRGRRRWRRRRAKRNPPAAAM